MISIVTIAPVNVTPKMTRSMMMKCKKTVINAFYIGYLREEINEILCKCNI